MKRNKKEELLKWCRQQRLFSSVDVYKYGMNYYKSAERRVREFVEEGFVRRLPDEEAILKGLNRPGFARIAWYELI